MRVNPSLDVLRETSGARRTLRTESVKEKKKKRTKF